MEGLLPALLEIYDRQTDRPTNQQPADRSTRGVTYREVTLPIIGDHSQPFFSFICLSRVTLKELIEKCIRNKRQNPRNMQLALMEV